MKMSIELRISIRDEERRKLSKEFLIYEEVTLKMDDPIIKKCLDETLDEFKGIPDTVKINAILVAQ